MPVGAAALQLGGMDTVVTEARDASTFAEYLQKENGELPKKWIVIHRADDTWNIPTSLSNCMVAQEVHLFPSLPILAQCPALMTETADIPRFHIVTESRYDPHAGTVETPAKDAIPAFILKMPSITVGGVCACGSTVYKQAV